VEVIGLASKNDETGGARQTTSASGTSTFQQSEHEEPQAQVNRSIDQTKESVRKSIEEARREIPEYAQSVTDFHQQAMDSTQDIADNYLDSQREIINSIQSTWTNYMETVFWWLSPRKMSEMYSQTVSNYADNAVAGGRIWNKAMLANMDASKAYLRRAREASKDASKVSINTVRTFEKTSSQISQGNNERRNQSQTRQK
jgi:hypothetical protein